MFLDFSLNISDIFIENFRNFFFIWIFFWFSSFSSINFQISSLFLTFSSLIFLIISFVKSENIFAFILKKNNKLMVLQNTINSVIILNVSNERETTIVLTKNSKQNALTSIVHFDFVYSSNMFDLFIAETAGIHFYKVEEEKVHCKEVKFLPFVINYCWFEVFYLVYLIVLSEILLINFLMNFLDISIQFLLFFLKIAQKRDFICNFS